MEDSIFISKFAERADDRQPPRRVPRLEDHARPALASRTTSTSRPRSSREEFVAGEDGKLAKVRAAPRRDRRGAEEIEADRRLRRDRPRAPLGGRQGPGRHRRGRLHRHRARLDPDQPGRRLRRRRRRRPHLPPGGHRGRHRLHGRARRRALPARQRRRRSRPTGSPAASRPRSLRSSRWASARPVSFRSGSPVRSCRRPAFCRACSSCGRIATPACG